jgi:hypothetical protein
LFHSEQIRYLIVGGFAVGHYGYPRATGDLDVWVAVDAENAARLSSALRAFGFEAGSVTPAMFLESDQVIRMGVPPLRIEILTGITGVDFDACYDRRAQVVIDEVPVNLISFDDLKTNKRAAGRPRDIDDLQHLSD